MLFAIRGVADAARVRVYRHHWIAVGQAGRFARLTHAEGCRDVVFIGSLVRPALKEIRFDLQTLRWLPDILAAYRGGDDHLLSRTSRLVERLGLRLRAAHEVAPEILAPKGVLTRQRPDKRNQADIAWGLKLLGALSSFDVGQAVVVVDGHVVAVEGIDGTDNMLAHLRDMRRKGRLRTRPGRGVLVKAPKHRQDRRLDMPAIGPATIRAVKAAGLAGIAIIAGQTVVAEPERMIAAADRAGMFIFGVGKT